MGEVKLEAENGRIDPPDYCTCEFSRADAMGRRQPLPHAHAFRTDPHCFTCHSSDHNACIVCQRCIATGRRFGEWHYRQHRVDRLYCSNACRQRAYRQRGCVTLISTGIIRNAGLSATEWESLRMVEEAETASWHQVLDGMAAEGAA
jgi:hypothetical protein